MTDRAKTETIIFKTILFLDFERVVYEKNIEQQ